MARQFDLKECYNIMARNDRSILDRDVPDIGVQPLKPTKYENAKNNVVNFVKSNTRKVADWILNLKPKTIKSLLPLKILGMILWSKIHSNQPSYWQINMSNNDKDATGTSSSKMF